MGVSRIYNIRDVTGRQLPITAISFTRAKDIAVNRYGMVREGMTSVKHTRTFFTSLEMVEYVTRMYKKISTQDKLIAGGMRHKKMNGTYTISSR